MAVLLLGPIVVSLVGAIVGLVYLGIDRVLVARMQARVGPPIAQPFRDVSKLMMKESICLLYTSDAADE